MKLFGRSDWATLAALSASALWRKHQDSMAETEADCSWWAATLVITTRAGPNSHKSSEISFHKSVCRPFGRTFTWPLKSLQTRSTTPWQSHQIRTGLLRARAMRNDSKTARTSARNAVCTNPGSGLAANTQDLDGLNQDISGSAWITDQLAKRQGFVGCKHEPSVNKSIHPSPVEKTVSHAVTFSSNSRSKCWYVLQEAGRKLQP